MSELAFSINGEPFEVPANATGWRVRRMKAKGAPEVVYGRNGQPLILPIEAEIEDVRAEVDAAGRYRVDPVDETNKPIEGAPAGYVFVHGQGAATAAPTSTVLATATDNVMIEAMRMNSEIAKSVVERFPQMMEAAATLLRAADGAGLPRREPIDFGEDEPAGDEATRSTPQGADFLTGLVAQIVPIVLSSMANKKLPKLDQVLDWRKAAPPKAAEPTPEPEVPADAPIAPETMAHFLAIQSALTPAEAARARALAAELTPAEVRGWLAELAPLAVPDAVAKIRSLLGGAA